MIRTKRLELGLTIETVAADLQANPVEIANFENGLASIEASLFFGIINMFNLTPEEIEPYIGRAELEARVSEGLKTC